MSKSSSSYFIEDSRWKEPIPREANKLRVFQTSMTDEELSKKSLIVTQFPENDEYWGEVFSDENGKKFPLLHSTDKKNKFTRSFILETIIMKSRKPESWRTRFEERASDLKSCSSEDGIEFSEESKSYAQKFLESIDFSRFPSIFLAGNGNMRILWSNPRKEQVGLQFKENGIVQYVLFKINNKDNSTHEHVMGAMKFDSIIELIKDLELDRILDGMT